MFTVADIDDLGIDRTAVRMMTRRGKVDHVAHGVYRFPEIPATEFDPYQLAVFWTGAPEACLSHDTALAGYDVCDINPGRIHVTVGAARRLRRRGGEQYVVHYENLDAGEVGWWNEIRTATLPTAIGQCIASGVPAYLLRQAIGTGHDRGDLTPAKTHTLTDLLDARDG
jgi:predicted transcriptional regulator of viral defense system